jgi:alpha-1,3-rhamnosyl/mannosyltransferase
MPLREQVLLPARLWRDHPDVVHAPCSSGPVCAPGPLVATIHDAIEFLERPRIRPISRESIRRTLMAQYNRWVQRATAHRASLVITVSEYSRSALTTALSFPEGRIRVIPLAHADRFRPGDASAARAALSARFALPASFVLALASASPRKNAAGLLRAYARLPIALRQRHALVMVLTHPLLHDAIRHDAERLGVNSQLHLLQGVGDAELALLYQAACVFAFPSLSEGFGLPVLEAMASGTPVVATALTSVPEVAGPAAELADPRNEVEFAAALERVLDNPERRAWLRVAGLRQAAGYSWRETARRTLDVYAEVAARAARGRQQRVSEREPKDLVSAAVYPARRWETAPLLQRRESVRPRTAGQKSSGGTDHGT